MAVLKVKNGDEWIPVVGSSDYDAEAADAILQENIDDKIWVGTAAEYAALGADVKPTTLYCLTDN